MRASASSGPHFFASAIIASCLALTSCSTLTAPLPKEGSGIAPISETPQPELLYLLGSPHSRLHVEVDAVEGSEPKAVALQQLRDFLSTYCNKPDGIEIVRSDVIPRKAARGVSPAGLARKYISGPVKPNAAPPAFLYVLFYDYGLSGNAAVIRAGHKGASKAPALLPKIPNPYAEVLPYPAIYFNPRFSFGLFLNEILLHEAGHVLGLVDRPIHARNGHCLNRGCQMNTPGPFLREGRWLPGRQQSPLCPECVAELKQRSTLRPPPNLRFIGPVLVRSEGNYHVLNLPDRLMLVIGDLAEQDVEKFATAVKAEKPGPQDENRMRRLVKDEALHVPATLADIARRMKADPFEVVQRFGPAILLQASGQRYHALGQHGKVVEVLEQAILLEPKNAWNYNRLAWIKATCADPSVRNGKEAVAAAMKSCELAGWNNWRFIDALAAAYAEAGDFKRAVEFGEQALRTGSPNDADRKALRDRVSLYKQSQPFREKQSEL